MPSMTSEPQLPLCCAPLQDHWPFARPMPGVHLLSTRFDPALLDPGDFARWGVPTLAAVNKRQTEFLAGRLCAHEALRRLLGVPSIPAVAEDRSPCWPSGVVGSITHGGGWAGVIAARAE